MSSNNCTVNSSSYDIYVYKLIHDNTEMKQLCKNVSLNACYYINITHAFLYEKNDSYTPYDVFESEIIEGSKKEYLYNSIVNKNYIITNSYSYSACYNSIDAKLGWISFAEYNASFLGNNTYLKDNMIIGYYCDGYITDTQRSFRKSSNDLFSTMVKIAYDVKVDRNDGQNCTYSNVFGLSGADYYPVITLNSNVEIINNKDSGCTGDNLGTKECPYKLICEAC